MKTKAGNAACTVASNKLEPLKSMQQYYSSVVNLMWLLNTSINEPALLLTLTALMRLHYVYYSINVKGHNAYMQNRWSVEQVLHSEGAAAL